VALCDLHGKNDFQLVLVDESCLPNRLKLYKGLKTAVESVLADPPAAIIAFVCDSVIGNWNGISSGNYVIKGK
jgi:hypothetical protein